MRAGYRGGAECEKRSPIEAKDDSLLIQESDLPSTTFPDFSAL
jgi:hypothetical protein